MKKLIALLALPFLPLSVEAGSRTYQPGYSQEQTCYEYVYREEYIPGTQSNPGRVVSSRESCLLYTSPSPRDRQKSRMPSSA